MGKPKAPKPASPTATGAAQTAVNIGSAIAQQNLNNVNQVTPDGNLTYSQTGSYEYVDPLNGKTHDIPTYTATQTLSDEQQAIADQNNAASLNFATLAANQSSRLDDLLGRPQDVSGLPDRGDVNNIRDLDLQRVGSGPALSTGYDNGGTIQSSVADAGSIQNGYDAGGDVSRLGQGPDLQNQISSGGNIQMNVGDAGDITKTYGANDFSDDRQRVEDALMARMDPGLQQDRDALENRLASQGIRIGSPAYAAAMDDLNRSSNDARMSAILSAGQEQTRLTNMDAQRAAFENSAQAQQYGQNANNATFANSAQAQQFGQNTTQAQFNNAALQQEFANDAQRTGINNAAQAQQNSQNAAAAAFGNSAQAQQFGQNAANAQLNNSAQAQQNGQNANAAQFNNAAQQQMYANAASGIQMDNQAATQETNSDIAKFDAANTARNSALQEEFALRNQPINEISALMSGSQVSNPNFITPNTAQLATTDFAGIQANYDNLKQQQYQQEMAQANSMWGGILGAGANLLTLSDRRAKKDVRKVGKTDDGQNIYQYRYKDGIGAPKGIQMGLMAQEVEKKKPGAVVDTGEFKMVDYAKALGGKK